MERRVNVIHVQTICKSSNCSSANRSQSLMIVYIGKKDEIRNTLSVDNKIYEK